MIGMKVIGFWGAMYPWDEGVIKRYDFETDEIVIEWDAEPGYKPKLGYYNTKNIRGEWAECNGVGIYYNLEKL